MPGAAGLCAGCGWTFAAASAILFFMKEEKDKERLDKVLSNNGFGSRKSVRSLIRSGAVSVNGQTVLLPDAHVSVTLDRICVNGEEQRVIRHVYLMMNKAAGYVCSNCLTKPIWASTWAERLPPSAAWTLTPKGCSCSRRTAA